jgi:predicted dehydrogenase
MHRMKIALIEVSHWHAPLYLEALASSGAQVVAVSDQDPAVARRVAERLGCRADADYPTMLREVRPDFVFAFGRHREMPAIAAHLIRARLPFAMEKPMGLSGEEVVALRALAESQGAFIAVPFVFRYSPIQEVIDGLRASGRFGELTNGYFRFIAGPPSRYTQGDSAWLLDPATSGGGCTINLSVHFLDLSLALLGPRVVESVYAVLGRRKYGGPVEDFSTVLLSTGDGVACTIETGYAYPSDPAHPRHLELCLTTTTGYLEVREGQYAWAGHDGVRIERAIDTDTDRFYPLFVRRTLSDFASGARPITSVGDMARVMALVDAAYRSSRERGPIRP